MRHITFHHLPLLATMVQYVLAARGRARLDDPPCIFRLEDIQPDARSSSTSSPSTAKKVYTSSGPSLKPKEHSSQTPKSIPTLDPSIFDPQFDSDELLTPFSSPRSLRSVPGAPVKPGTCVSKQDDSDDEELALRKHAESVARFKEEETDSEIDNEAPESDPEALREKLEKGHLGEVDGIFEMDDGQQDSSSEPQVSNDVYLVGVLKNLGFDAVYEPTVGRTD